VSIAWAAWHSRPPGLAAGARPARCHGRDAERPWGRVGDPPDVHGSARGPGRPAAL